MNRWFEQLFGRPPWQPPLGERRYGRTDESVREPERRWDDPPVGSVMGEIVGRTAQVEASRSRPFMHPGAGLREGPSTLTEQDFAAADAMVRWQRGNADDMRRLNQRALRAPRLPVMVGEEVAPAFPFAQPAPTGSPADRASRATGVPLSYIGALTGHESGGDADAKAPTSSATGHGQFIDDTWYRMLRVYGPRYGLDVTQLDQDEQLELRRDPQWSALMIAEYAEENAAVLRRGVGREVSQGEVYLGHWLGPEAAVPLIQAVERDRRRERGQQTLGRSVVSNGAFVANMPIFYTREARFRLEGPPGRRRFVYLGGGRPRTVTEVYEAQTRAFPRELYQTQARGVAN